MININSNKSLFQRSIFIFFKQLLIFKNNYLKCHTIDAYTSQTERIRDLF